MNSDNRNVSFEAGGVSATVRPLLTTRDSMFEGLVERKLIKGLTDRGGEWAEITDRNITSEYARAVLSTVESEGFSVPAISATAEQHAAAFEAWVSLPSSVVGAWLIAMKQANEPVNDPDLVPPALLTDEKKDTPLTSEPPTAPVLMSA